MEKPRVFVGMSGGVDSSVAAVLLQQAGYCVSGITGQMFRGGAQDSCKTDAAAVAQRLGIPFYQLDLTKEFWDTVIYNFISEYEQGRTPNPCAVCNRTVKFGALLDKVLEMGGDYLATGHYARISRDPDTGRYLLKRGADQRKDQSYFLYNLTQEQLAHTLFPLGNMVKEQVRELAETYGLINARKRDSQDICFVPNGKYADFIEQTTGKVFAAGPYLDQAGTVLGQHKGIIRYTRGQHKKLGISTQEPMYVLEKDVENNAIRLGPESALWSKTLTAENMNWISVPELTMPVRVTVKTRYSQKEAVAIAEPLPGNRLRVVFEEPQRAITAGQAVVLYDGDTVVGGGIICGE